MTRINQILAHVSSPTSGRKYEVALEVDEFDNPKVWVTGPGAGQPRVHCNCMSMRNRTGTDERGNCKHIRAVLGYQSKSGTLNRRSRNLIVEDKEAACLVRAWGTQVPWTYEQSHAALTQGWDLFCTGGAGHPPYQLQRIDFPEDESDAVFPGDFEAHEFVRRQAEAGDALALAALEFLKENSPEEHATVLTPKVSKGKISP